MSEWISVKDKLPDTTGRYWCFVRYVSDLTECEYQWNCCYNEFANKFITDDDGHVVTHWMPLPPPPITNKS